MSAYPFNGQMRTGTGPALVTTNIAILITIVTLLMLLSLSLLSLLSLYLLSGWKNRKIVSEVLCDRRINSKVKGKYTKTVGKPAIMYGVETCAVKKVGCGGNEDADMDCMPLNSCKYQ